MDYRVVIKGSEPAGRVRKSEKRIKMHNQHEITEWFKKASFQFPRLRNKVKPAVYRSLNPDE